jgi:hypothetical protein
LDPRIKKEKRKKIYQKIIAMKKKMAEHPENGQKLVEEVQKYKD